MSAFDRRHDLAIDTATFVIAGQCASAGIEAGHAAPGSRMTGEFALGYVWGVCEGVHEICEIAFSKEWLAAVAIVYLNVYGNSLGAESCGRALRLQESPAGDFGRGMTLGRQEATARLRSEGGAPKGLAEFLAS